MDGERRATRFETVRGAALGPAPACEDVPEWHPKPPCGPDPVTAIAVGIKRCLCDALAACDRPVCWCCVVNSNEVATAEWCNCPCQPGCCKEGDPKDLTGALPAVTGVPPAAEQEPHPEPVWQGMAWVRIATQQWVSQQGRQTTTASGGLCAGGGLWRVTFNFGVMRCTKGVQSPRPISCDNRESDAFVAFADAEIMRWVVSCCPALKRFPLQAAQWTPIPPQGGCAGGVMAVTVDLRPPSDATGCPIPERFC